MTDLLTFEDDFAWMWAMFLLPIGVSMITVPWTRRSFVPLAAWASLAAVTALVYRYVPRSISNETFMVLALLWFAALVGAIATSVITLGSAMVDRRHVRRRP